MTTEDTPTDEVETEYVWTEKIEAFLRIIRANCIYLSNYHNYKYKYYKSRYKYYRIPIIVLSAINAFVAIGFQTYLRQTDISTINSLLSLLCGIITSVEMFLGIQKKMELELVSHKDYHILSLEIFKMISLEPHKRNVDGKSFLDEKFGEFRKLIQTSNVVDFHYFSGMDEMENHVAETLSSVYDDEDNSNWEHDNKVIKDENAWSDCASILLTHGEGGQFRKMLKADRPSSKTHDKEVLHKIHSKLTKLYNPSMHEMMKQRKRTQDAITEISKQLKPHRYESCEDLTEAALAETMNKTTSPSRTPTRQQQQHHTNKMAAFSRNSSANNQREPSVNNQRDITREQIVYPSEEMVPYPEFDV